MEISVFHLFNQMKNSRLPSPPVIGLSSQALTVRPRPAAQCSSLASTSLVERRVANDAALADVAGTDFELRLDEQQQVAMRGEQCRQLRQDQRQRDEGKVADDQVEAACGKGRAEIGGGQGAAVDAFDAR